MSDDVEKRIVDSPKPLSGEQSEAVLSISRYIRVSAGAGTGKTETLTRRIVYLILHERVAPKEIVAFTFTDKAAQNMKSRIYEEVERLGGKEACLKLGDMYVGTIHGFCLRMLQNSLDYGDYEVFNENQEMAFVLRKGWDLGLEKEHYFNSCESFLRSVNVVYNELIDYKKLEEKSHAFYIKLRLYEEILKKNKRLSFSQIISFAVRHIENSPKSVLYIRHLLVDEYQDINRAQENLVKLIGKNANIFVVGDPRQTIYKWRGSNEGLFENFKTIFSGVQDISLSENRRSSKSVIAVANAISEQMTNKSKPLKPLRNEEGFAGSIDFGSKEEEANWIVKRIKDLVEVKKCANYSDIAILFRSVKISGEPFLKELRKLNVPFTIGGNSGLFQKDEVQAIARLFSWLSYKGFWQVGFGINKNEIRDEELLKTGIQKWKQATNIQLGEKEIDSLKSWKKKAENEGFRTLIDAYYELLVILRYKELDWHDQIKSNVMANLGGFSSLLSDYDVAISFGGRPSPLKTYFSDLCFFMNFYATSSYEEQNEEETSKNDAVQLMTIHQAKGLEWNFVFIPSFIEGKFPQSRTGIKQRWEISEELFDRLRYEGEENDERRLVYVAITRAKENLLISYNLERENDHKSRFLEEMQSNLKKLRLTDDMPGSEYGKGKDEELLNTFFTGELIEYFRCPYFYRFRNVWEYKPEIVGPLGYGKSLHYCLRLVANNLEDKNLKETVKNIFSKNFSLPFAPESLREKLAVKGEKVLSDFVSKNEGDIRNIESVEVRVEFPLKRSTVVGKADVIIKNEAKGGIEVRDYKTSDKVISKEESDMQVRLYSIGFKTLGKNPVEGSIANLEENEIRYLTVAEQDLEKTQKTTENVIEGILEKKFEPIVGLHCRTCDFNRICMAGSNYLSRNP